ncbi:hypothetical protein J6590_093516 [Homalodisca vitripennis]|nr:hypothetical protein J6590_093516 [Homalodisca vitripennis]
MPFNCRKLRPRVLCCEEFLHLFSIQYLDARQDNLEEPRSQRLLFDELFWFGGSSSSPDDDEKPGLASCSCRKPKQNVMLFLVCFDWNGWFYASFPFFERDISIIPYESLDMRGPNSSIIHTKYPVTP